ncbi:hypothetical protein J6590_051181 [Homalodisca vitripennis]|nr:hypothetical protein J6590_051181 [Homalodisca vitripennis]
MLDGLADMAVPRSRPHCPSSIYGTGRLTAEVERLQQLTHHLTIHHRPDPDPTAPLASTALGGRLLKLKGSSSSLIT